jgi:integration host factor subunit alpha
MTEPQKLGRPGRRAPRSLTREGLVAALRRETGLDKQSCTRLLEDILTLLSDRLVAGEDVRIRGFGTFRVAQKAARHGRNPRTNAPAMITPRRVVQFRPASDMRQRVAQATPDGDLRRRGSGEDGA